MFEYTSPSPVHVPPDHEMSVEHASLLDLMSCQSPSPIHFYAGTPENSETFMGEPNVSDTQCSNAANRLSPALANRSHSAPPNTDFATSSKDFRFDFSVENMRKVFNASGRRETSIYDVNNYRSPTPLHTGTTPPAGLQLLNRSPPPLTTPEDVADDLGIRPSFEGYLDGPYSPPPSTSTGFSNPTASSGALPSGYVETETPRVFHVAGSDIRNAWTYLTPYHSGRTLTYTSPSGRIGRSPMFDAMKDLFWFSLHQTTLPSAGIIKAWRRWAPRHRLTIQLLEDLLEYPQRYPVLYPARLVSPCNRFIVFIGNIFAFSFLIIRLQMPIRMPHLALIRMLTRILSWILLRMLLAQ